MPAELAAALAALAAAVVPAPGPTPSMATELLKRHRPVLSYDRAERHRAIGVEPFLRDGVPGELSSEPTAAGTPDAVYGRVVRDADRDWLQYWLFFAYNGQDRGILRTGRHEGDWEFFQIRLDAARRPDAATFGQHSSEAGCDWDDLHHRSESPVVFVSNASHALYPRAGVHDRPFPDPNDETRGGNFTELDVTRIDENSPAWVQFDGHWGDSRAGIVPGEQPSPRGPAFQGERWDHPARVHAEARSCFSAPAGPMRWLMPAGLLAALAAVVALALLTRRRRA